jgi:hypothetical protein
MTTVSRLHRLCGWSVRCASAAFALIICASAFADPSKDGPVISKHAVAHKKNVRKVCYIYISGSGIPQPCERLGTIPTTAIPLQIVGRNPVEIEK